MLKHPGRIHTFAGKAHGNTLLASPKHPGSHTGVWHFRVHFTAGKFQSSSGMCQHKASYPSSAYKWEDIKCRCQLSCWLRWQRSLLVSSRLLLGMCSWNHAQQFMSWGAWIPVFWPQKMTSGCVLRVPGLQSQGSLAAVPCDTLIEPFITWSRSVFALQNSCGFQGLGWLVLF